MDKPETTVNRGTIKADAGWCEIVISTADVPTNLTIRKAIVEFWDLLESRSSEAVLHEFLASHLYFWNGLLRQGTDLFSKVRLAAEFEVDFACCDPGSTGAEWHLIEIESAAARLFSKRGEPSQVLHHAMTQVRDWQRWIERNRAYSEQLLPGVDRPMAHVFIGRRAELKSPAASQRLRDLNVQNRAHVQVHTLDHFLSLGESALTLRARSFPRRALTDRELRTKFPDGLRAFIESPMGRDHRFTRNRLSHRISVEEHKRSPVPPPTRVRRSVIGHQGLKWL